MFSCRRSILFGSRPFKKGFAIVQMSALKIFQTINRTYPFSFAKEDSLVADSL